MGAVECFAMTDGRMVQFVCGHSMECCGAECCPASGPFYAHWYFWLAVCMFLMVLIGFGVSACRHFRKERKRQCRRCCVMRPKPEIGADLLLNYHLMRTSGCKPADVLQRPPQYEEVMATQRPLLAAGSLPVAIFPPPPAYTFSSSNGNGAIIHSNGTTSSAEEAYPSQPPPPYYQLCAVQEEEEEEVHSVLAPSATADMT